MTHKTLTAVQALQSYTPATAPTLSTSAGGTLAAATVYAKLVAVTAVGTSLPSPESSNANAIDTVLNVAIPALVSPVIGYDVYVGSTSNAETKQNSTPVTAASWVEPTSGLIAGAAPPTVDTSGNQSITVYTVPAAQFDIAPFLDITDIEITSNVSAFTEVQVSVGGNVVATEFVSDTQPVRIHGEDSPISAAAGAAIVVTLPSGPATTTVAVTVNGMAGEN